MEIRFKPWVLFLVINRLLFQSFVLCSNGRFRGLVWCFKSDGGGGVWLDWCVLVGWFNGASISVSLVVEERDRDEEMREKSIVFLLLFFYSICFVVYIILLDCV